MRIVIAGPGALGCLLAARISSVLEADDELTLLDHRSERARQMNNDGFTLEDEGKAGHYSVPATADPTRISGCDLFFLCTRSKSVAGALAQAGSLLSPATLLISMQRGISHLPAIKKNAAIAAVAVTSADVSQKSPGQTCCLDPGRMQIGLLDKTTENKQLLNQAVVLLNRAGLKPEKKQDMMQHAWDSFFIDLAVNALAAIYRRPNGQLLTSCSVRGNMKKALNEAVTVARANNIPINNDPVKSAFQFLRTEKNRIAPMLLDVKNNRSTEVDALNGTISEMGRKLAIPTPVNDDFVMRIKKIEARYL